MNGKEESENKKRVPTGVDIQSCNTGEKEIQADISSQKKACGNKRGPQEYLSSKN